MTVMPTPAYEVSADRTRNNHNEWEWLLNDGRWGTPCLAMPARRFRNQSAAAAAWTATHDLLPRPGTWRGSIYRSNETGPPVRNLP